MPALPARFGRFTLLDELGAGGMGRVYRAAIEGPDGFRKELAVKVLLAESDRDPELRAQSLAKEARIGALLRHPHLVDLYDYGIEGDQPWFSMELVPGRSLERLLAEEGPLPPARAVDLLAQIARGLAALHEAVIEGEPAGLVHRDLKPGNVLVTPDDHVKLADFGIARGRHKMTATVTETLRGTPAYMAPEQAQAGEVDPRSDLFSLGLIGWELITGERLVQGESLFQLLFSLMRIDDRQAEVRALDGEAPGLGTLLARLCAADPAERPTSARAVREELLALRAGPSTARPVRPATDPAETVAWTPPAERQSNVPSSVDAFVGRHAELQALGEAVQPGRVVSLLGPGGTGKTRLAQEFARVHAGNHRGGTWFVDLVEARSQQGICAAVAQALGVQMNRGADDAVGRIGDALAGRGRVLLVLDNFEQIQAFAAETVGAWVARCPEASVLVTTQQRLGLGVERVVRIGPLPFPEPRGATAAAIADHDAVRLFVDRARRARPDFVLDDANAPAVAGLVHALEGIPLAIELAAARVRVLSPQRLLERLPQRFALLSTRRRDVTERQATLRATIEWSWNLLEPWEQAALVQTAVFAGGFTVEAAEAVVDLADHPDAPWVLDVIQALEDKSLLRSSTAPSGDVRFAHYVSIRAFALEQLEGDGPARRHLAFYAARGSERAIDSLSERGGQARRARLAEDLENLGVAAERAGDLGAPDDGANAALGLAHHLADVGPLALGEQHLTVALDRGPSARQRIRLQLMRGHLRALQGVGDHGEVDLTEAEQAAAELKDARLEGEAWARLGRLHMNSPDAGRSALLQRAQERFAELGDARREAWVLCAQAVRAAVQGRFEEARTKNEQALQKLRGTGDQAATLVALGNLAVAYKELGMIMLQLATLNEALRLARDLGTRRYEAIVLINLGVHHQLTGKLRQAEACYRQAHELSRVIGMRDIEGIAQGNLGDALKDQGRLLEALPLLREGLEISRATGNVRHRVGQLFELSMVLLTLGRVDEAADAVAEARELAPAMGNPRQVGEVAIADAWLARARGDLDGAAIHLDGADAVLADLPETRFYLRARLERARLLRQRGEPEAALALCRQLQDEARELQDPMQLGLVLLVRGRAERDAGRSTAPTAAALAEALDGLELADESPLKQGLADLRR